MKADEPCFSVIVPVYHVRDYLERCVESILAQTFVDFELILVEDGSEDGCLEICKKYEAKEKRIRLIIHEKNCGLVASRKDGLRTSRGKYIIYVDADDRIREDMLGEAACAIERDHDPDMVIFASYMETERGIKLMETNARTGYYNREQIKKELFPELIWDPARPFCDGKMPRFAWAKAYRREFLLRHYCRDERIANGEDAAFVYECGLYAKSLTFVPEAVYYYNRENVSSMTRMYSSFDVKDIGRVMEYIRKRIGGKTPGIDRQINALQAWYMMRMVYIESEMQPTLKAYTNVKKQISGSAFSKIDLSGLPFLVQAYCFLIRSGVVFPVLLATKLRLWL